MDASIFSTVVFLGLGCLLADVVVGRRESGRAERMVSSMAWGPGLAAGIVSLLSFFLVATGLSRFGRVAVPVGLVVAVLVAWRAVDRKAANLGVRTDSSESGRTGIRAGSVTLAAVGVGYVWTFVQWLVHRPLGSYDAMGIWTYRALQWFRSGDAFPNTVALLVESKPGYPLLLPGLITSQFVLWGGETTVIPVATGWFFVIGLAAATYMGVVRWASPAVALVATGLVLSTPMVWRSAFAQGADLALAYFTLVAAIGLADFVNRGRRALTPPWLVGFFLGLMVWTKNEGMIIASILVVVSLAVTWLGGGRPSRSKSLVVGIGALPGVLAAAYYKTAWVSVGEMGRFVGDGFVERLADSSRWREVAAAIGERLIPWSGEAVWGGSVVVIAAVLGLTVCFSGRSGIGRAAGFYFLAAATVTSFFVFVYLVTPDPLGWHLQTSLDRLLLQVLPVSVVAAFAAFGSVFFERPYRGSE